jgi:hypothetical protein
LIVPEVTAIKDAMVVYQTKLTNIPLLKVLNKKPLIHILEKMVLALTIKLPPLWLTLPTLMLPLTHQLNYKLPLLNNQPPS